MSELSEWLQRWAAWSGGADRAENGWQSDFPEWDVLLGACKRAMMSENSLSQLEDIARCWALSEEDEELAEYARSRLNSVAQIVAALSSHPDPDVRWQAIDVIGDSDDGWAADVLRRGFTDEESYVRQRSFLAFARRRSVDMALIDAVLRDESPHVRRVAWELALKTNDATVLETVRRRMTQDSSSVVRDAVQVVT